jgi:hypothetical protein
LAREHVAQQFALFSAALASDFDNSAGSHLASAEARAVRVVAVVDMVGGSSLL